MKLLKTGAMAALLTVGYLHTSAQNAAPPVNEPDYNKPRIFADLPDNLTIRVTDMDALLNLAEGAAVNATIATGFTLTGTVVSKSNPADLTSKSIVIKSNARLGATLTFTRIKNSDGSFSYRGRIMSKNAGDAFEIVKEGNNYIIRKKGYYDLINE